MTEYLDRLYWAILALVSGGFTWVIRTVVTNNTKVALVELQLESLKVNSNNHHKETREDIRRLVESNDKAITNQQKIMEKLIDKQLDI